MSLNDKKLMGKQLPTGTLSSQTAAVNLSATEEKKCLIFNGIFKLQISKRPYEAPGTCKMPDITIVSSNIYMELLKTNDNNDRPCKIPKSTSNPLTN